MEIALKSRIFIVASALAAAALLYSYGPAVAHTTVHVGNYDVEVGWADEPPLVGQRNAIVINVSNPANANAQVDVSKLTVDVTYGGQTKTLALQPLGESTVNQYIAPLLPTVPGQYTLQLRGQLDTTEISQDVQPEEVLPADTLNFPNMDSSQPGPSLNWSGWLSAGGVIFGLAGLVIALLAYRKAH